LPSRPSWVRSVVYLARYEARPDGKFAGPAAETATEFNSRNEAMAAIALICFVMEGPWLETFISSTLLLD
jgi:hypothetical protein